jgi:hypothetical protein
VSLARLVRDETIEAGTGCGNNTSHQVPEFGNALVRFQRISELCEAAFWNWGGFKKPELTKSQLADMSRTGGCRGGIDDDT